MKTKQATKKTKPLVFADNQSAFWINQGPTLRSLLDLVKFLGIITDEQFTYHTKRNGNDFARWVADVLKDQTCASALKRAGTKAAALTAARRALARYQI